MRLEKSDAALLLREKGIGTAITLTFHAAFAICGFLFASKGVFDNYHPFGAALCAAVPGEYLIVTTLGSAAGYIFSDITGSAFSYVAATVIIALARWLCSGLFKNSPAGFASFCFAAVSLGVCGTIPVAVSGGMNVSLVLSIAEGLLAGAVSYFFSRFFTVTLNGTKRHTLTSQELACAVISLAVLFLSLSDLTIASVSPARVIMLIIVLAAAFYGKEASGCIAGTAAGLTMALSGPDYLYAAAGFSLAGLLSGVFSPTGKIGTAAAFVITNGIIVLATPDNTVLIPILYEVMAATVLFILLPKRAGKFFAAIFTPVVYEKDETLRENLIMRLRFASFALCDVAKTVDKVAEKLKKASSPELEDVFKKTECRICSHCTLRIFCWETNRKSTLDALMTGVTLMSKGIKITHNDLNDTFIKHCAHPAELTQALNQYYTEFRTRRSADRRVSEIRGVVSEQFEGISSMLDNLAGEFEDFQSYDTATAERIREALISSHVIPDDISCRCDRFGRMTAEICIPTPDEHINRSILMRELSLVCDRDFDVPCVTTAQDRTLLTLSERAAYSVDFGAYQVTSEGNRLCGDACEQFYDGKGRAVMIISDGMGSGGRAAVDGAMAAGLMSRLIKGGFGYDCALNIVNSAMLFKSGDESLATVDVAVIDLFSGVTEIYKAGAPLSIIRKSGKALFAEGASLPPGIVKDVSFDKSMLTLGDTDIVVMVSDGALSDGADWIGVEIEVCRHMTAQQLSEHIADYARRRAGADHPDDITVLTAIINKN